MQLRELPGQLVGLVTRVDDDPLLLVVSQVDIYVEHGFLSCRLSGVFCQDEVVLQILPGLTCLLSVLGSHQHLVVFGRLVRLFLLRLEVLVEVLFQHVIVTAFEEHIVVRVALHFLPG